MTLELSLSDEAATISLGQKIARALSQPLRLYLQGDIGMGKTTLTRAILQQLGVSGAIKSPTFALCEPYTVEQNEIYHYDLYRLSAPEELDYLGWQENFDSAYLVVVEWPERAAGELPEPSLLIELVAQGNSRRAAITAFDEVGKRMLLQLGETA